MEKEQMGVGGGGHSVLCIHWGSVSKIAGEFPIIYLSDLPSPSFGQS